MKVLSKTIPYQVGQKFKFVCFSDVHHGHANSSTRLFKTELVDRYKDREDCFFLDLGDGMDMIVPNCGDKRFKASQIDDKYIGIDHPLDAQIEGYASMLEPIKDRMIALLDGNHSLSVLEKYGTNPTRRLAYLLWGGKDMEQRTYGYSGFLTTRFVYKGSNNSRVRTLTWSLTHGMSTGASKTLGGYITSMGGDSSYYIADIHAYGHNHRLVGVDRIRIGVDGKKKNLVSKKEIVLNTGTFLKAFSEGSMDTSYAEKARYIPGELGFMELTVKMDRAGMEIYHVKRSLL